MKIRILSIACVTTAATLLAACTAVYKNTDACEQLMRSKLAETSSPDTLKITHTGAGIDGSRVVVEGSIEHVVTASEVAAASAPSPAASAAPVANAPRPASGARAASAMSAASSASDATDATAASGVTAGVASGAVAASASVAASGADAASLKSSKPKKTRMAAAAECTFHGSALSVFSWLAPEKLVTPADGAAGEGTE
ncbi:hypothetical protein R69927_02177 [Paraburkholderia domus]|jgi:hypothetical protein|uniref:hypothetical protein n=1 Tax=Paraburkholderia domus TaxID=2793075 RepID=UPI001912DFDD|nr:hypothetical protein [Paraburkholderia domus]MBK5064273.1 hypothetical protein [Burkholderia sp. R-70199]MBK5086768.1 hypothetical protein [Burkholderia sp. R-69927]MBK5185316.1 hypothetical protein [Burkholderia sp. R-69749]CAE6853079.1 hypothetical protein R69927_02177 [Paraburkholderia domus]CAE6887073.1 hypothetical protein R69749_07387 [Paraburkholderia domus]